MPPASSPADTSSAVLPFGTASLDAQADALQRTQACFIHWREASASSAAAHAFVERDRQIPAHVWKTMIPCGVLPLPGPTDRDPSRLLVTALATAAPTPMDAARLLESACQAGVLLRRDAAFQDAGRAVHGAAWRGMSPADQRAALQTLIAQQAQRGHAPTAYYTDYPVVVRDGAEGRTARDYGHWLAVPLQQRHPETGAVTLTGFAYRSLRPLAETGVDYRHRRSRRNGFGDSRGLLMGLADFGDALRARRAAVVVEGTMDWLAACAAYDAAPHRALPPVGVQGVELTSGEMDALAAVAPRIVALLDFDSAGQRGTTTFGQGLLARGTAVYVGNRDALTARGMPDAAVAACKDPSDIVRHGGVDALVACQVAAMRRPLPSHQLAAYTAAIVSDPALRTRRQQWAALVAVAPSIAYWPESTHTFVAEAAAALDLDPAAVGLEVAAVPPLPVRRHVTPAVTPESNVSSSPSGSVLAAPAGVRRVSPARRGR